MNAPASTAFAERPMATGPIPSEIRHSVEKKSALSQHAKQIPADTDAERMSTTLVRMISNSVGELDALVLELQGVQAFLKSEGERIQREIMNYAQLNQSALAAIKVISETIGP